MHIKFPSSFLWGAAISSYQCEGDNIYSDWYSWEKQNNLENAGKACNHYNLFDEDFQLASQLSLNSLRLSIEWARICPQASTFIDKEISHYLEVVDTLLRYKLRPVVTLHHFTNPIWFTDSGGWSNSKNIDYFLKYLKKIVDALKHKVDFWLIFNEPLVYIYNSFIRGIWPPGSKSLKEAKRVLDNITKAYIIGYDEIKNIYSSSYLTPKISLAKHQRVFSGCPDSTFVLNSFSAFLRNRYFNFRLLDRLANKDKLDFIALNYYCKEYTKFKGLVGRRCNHASHRERKNHLGWDIYPQGFYEMLLKLSRYKLPIMITENGSAEEEDSNYQAYLLTHLQSLAKAFSEGVDIIGYFWWSLLDNFEWDKGFKHRFGLVEVDYNTFDRKIKPFAYTYAKICSENKLDT